MPVFSYLLPKASLLWWDQELFSWNGEGFVQIVVIRFLWNPCHEHFLTHCFWKWCDCSFVSPHTALDVKGRTVWTDDYILLPCHGLYGCVGIKYQVFFYTVYFLKRYILYTVEYTLVEHAGDVFLSLFFLRIHWRWISQTLQNTLWLERFLFVVFMLLWVWFRNLRLLILIIECVVVFWVVLF